jgi:hypothetical protein
VGDKRAFRLAGLQKKTNHLIVSGLSKV